MYVFVKPSFSLQINYDVLKKLGSECDATIDRLSREADSEEMDQKKPRFVFRMLLIAAKLYPSYLAYIICILAIAIESTLPNYPVFMVFRKSCAQIMRYRIRPIVRQMFRFFFGF